MLDSIQKQRYLDNFLNRSSNLIEAISTNQEFISFIKNGSNQQDTEDLLYSMIKIDKSYMQLRFIDFKGDEIIRFDRENVGSKVYKQTKLQNKSKRYYCQKCLKLKKEEILYSNIDLNIEHGSIQKPIKPVIRISLPIVIKGKYLGFLILNVFMNQYLNDLTESSIYDLYLSDLSGNFLISKNSQNNWSKYLNKKINALDEFNILKKNFKKDTFFSTKDRYFIKTLKISGYNNLKLIYFENLKQKELTKKLIEKRVLTTVLFAIFISFPFAYLVSFPISKLYDSLEIEAENIAEQANNLELRVQIEIEKNRAKDRLLENQSKLAALGEMIGNIAHQWRHPITRLSLMIQNLKSLHDADKLTSNMFSRYYKNSLDQIDYMSQTIEDFRNFYKQDSKKSLFEPSIAINSAFKIVNASIKHGGIELSLKVQDQFKILGFANQFSQVILNIIQNAKDALEENNIKNPYIDISLYQKNGRNIIEIKDNAKGIKEDIIEKIFDAHITTKRQNGTGIGLYMSKTIIEDNFDAKLYARNWGDGAIFTIEFNVS
ncbi:MAG: HAMP domain-containing histidine kinase [Epsilonproteobacteria bacterium]|nr:HAMP domain-containing histidine kinase [Campylobacterota bacterium]